MFFSKEREKEVINWLEAHSYRLAEPIDCASQDFSFLKSVIQDKRIVWLGENGHFIREHTLLKEKIISFLHKEMGFNVLAFESGLAEAYGANELKEASTPEAFMKNSIYSLWATEDTEPLFHLLKRQDFRLAGIDINPSSIPDTFLRFVAKLQPLVTEEQLQAFEFIERGAYEWYYKIGQYTAARKKVPKDVLQLFEHFKEQAITKVNDLIKSIQFHLLNEREQAKETYLHVMQRSLANRLYFLNHLTEDHRTYKKVREQRLCENVEWLCNELYPNEKIIIWAHNMHIFKNFRSFFSKFEPMGSKISKTLQNDSYYMGLFMYEGETITDTGQAYKLSKPPKKSLEDYLSKVNSPTTFVDFSQLQKQRENEWIFKKTIFLDSGTMQTLITPREQMDGALFVQKVSPPPFKKEGEK